MDEMAENCEKIILKHDFYAIQINKTNEN